MFVEVKLFKTNFDKENIFVGQDKLDRQSIFDKFDENLTLSIPRASFNPNNMFRIKKNFFELDKKYNYIEYKFFMKKNDVTPIDIRHYNILNFYYLNDEITTIDVAEDFWGDRFYDLDFSQIQTNMYTHKKDDLCFKNCYETIPCPNYYRMIDKENEDYYNQPQILDGAKQRININGDDFFVMAMIVTMQFRDVGNTNADKYSLRRENTTEGNINYRLSTYLVPFLFDEFDGNILNKKISYQRISSGDDPNPTIQVRDFVGIDKLDVLGKLHEAQYVSSCVITDTKDLFRAKYDIETDSIVIQDRNFEISEERMLYYLLKTENGNDWNIGEEYAWCLRILNNKTLDKYNDFQTIGEININEFTRNPYYKVVIESNGEKMEIDLSNFISARKKGEPFNSITDYKIKIKSYVSVIPPYNRTYLFDASGDIFYYAMPYDSVSQNPTITIPNEQTFAIIVDSFADWLRQNYNAQVTGIKNQYEMMKFNNLHNLGKSLTSVAFGGLGSMVGGTSDTTSVTDSIRSVGDEASQIKVESNTVSTNNLFGKQMALKLASGTLHSATNFLLDREKAKNQKSMMESTMYNNMFDKMNIPNTFVQGSSVSDFILRFAYNRVYILENIKIDEIKKYHKMFGFKTNSYIKNIKSHKIFDFLSSGNIIINNENMFLTEEEKNAVLLNIRSGLRFWYDFENYKNFEIENEEVTEEQNG